MRLRVEFKEPLNSGSPDYTLCGQGFSTLDYTDLALTVLVNNTQIFTTGNYEIFNIPGGTTDADGIDVEALKEGNSNQILRLDIDLANIQDSTTVSIQASKSGYRAFVKTFTVFGYDLGNNVDDSVSGNPEFSVILIPTANNEVSGIETKVISSLVAYRKPLTDNIYVYRNNSSGLVGGYYDEDMTLLSNNNDFVLSHKKDIVLENRVGTCSSKVTVLEDKFFVPFELSLSNVGGGENYVTVDSNIEAGISLSLSEAKEYIKDGVAQYVSNSVDVEMQIINQGGFVVDSHTGTIDLTDPQTWTALVWTDVVVDEGTFNILKGSLIYISDNLSQTKSISVPTKRFYELEEESGVNQYVIYNRGGSLLEVDVFEMSTDNTFKKVWDFEVEALDSYFLDINRDGIFKFEYTSAGTTEIQVIAAYDNYKKCLVRVIQSAVCGKATSNCVCDVKGTADYYDFYSVITHSFTLFSLLKEHYEGSFYYTALDDSKLKELADMKKVLDSLDNTCLCTISTPKLGFDPDTEDSSCDTNTEIV